MGVDIVPTNITKEKNIPDINAALDLKFPVLHLSDKYTLNTQFNKILEEFNELNLAIQNNEDYIDIWGEYFDLFQSVIGLFQFLPINADDPRQCILNASEAHNNKLIHRASSSDQETLSRKRNLPIVGEVHLVVK